MTIEKRNKMEFVDYFGAVGGFLGLWMGASMVSFIQFGVFLFQFCFPSMDPSVEEPNVEEPEEQNVSFTFIKSKNCTYELYEI